MAQARRLLVRESLRRLNAKQETAKDWVSERKQGFIFLPVCFDKSVTRDTDEFVISNSKLTFSSTTDIAEIAGSSTVKVRPYWILGLGNSVLD